jgi:hypothetical protein
MSKEGRYKRLKQVASKLRIVLRDEGRHLVRVISNPSVLNLVKVLVKIKARTVQRHKHGFSICCAYL